MILIKSYHATLPVFRDLGLSDGVPLHLYGESACQPLIVFSAYPANHSTTQHF